jgi:hypothetical protein
MQTEMSPTTGKKLAWWQVLLIGAVLSPSIYLIKVGLDDIVPEAQAAQAAATTNKTAASP